MEYRVAVAETVVRQCMYLVEADSMAEAKAKALRGETEAEELLSIVGVVDRQLDGEHPAGRPEGCSLLSGEPSMDAKCIEQALRSDNACLAENGNGPAALTEPQIKALVEPLIDDLAELLGGDADQPVVKRTATREQWMIGIVIAAIANAVNAAFCAYNAEIEAVNEDPDYIAKVAAVVAGDFSTWQLEALQDVIEAAIPLCKSREQPRPPVGR